MKTQIEKELLQEIIAKRYMKPTEKDNIKKFEEINDKLPNE